MVKYVLVFLIKGVANKYHRSLTRKLAEKFKIENPSKRVAPHITMKFIGEIKSKDKIRELELFLTNFVKHEKKIKINLRKINNFGREVIFIDVVKTKSLLNFYNKLYSGLKKIKWMPLVSKFEGKNMHFHSTLAIGDIKRKSHEILQYLSKRSPNYELLLNNLVLIKKKGKRWIIHKGFKLK